MSQCHSFKKSPPTEYREKEERPVELALEKTKKKTCFSNVFFPCRIDAVYSTPVPKPFSLASLRWANLENVEFFYTVPEHYNPKIDLCAAHFMEDSFQNLREYNAGCLQKTKDGGILTLSEQSVVSGSQPVNMFVNTFYEIPG